MLRWKETSRFCAFNYISLKGIFECTAAINCLVARKEKWACVACSPAGVLFPRPAVAEDKEAGVVFLNQVGTLSRMQWQQFALWKFLLHSNICGPDGTLKPYELTGFDHSGRRLRH